MKMHSVPGFFYKLKVIHFAESENHGIYFNIL